MAKENSTVKHVKSLPKIVSASDMVFSSKEAFYEDCMRLLAYERAIAMKHHETWGPSRISWIEHKMQSV